MRLFGIESEYRKETNRRTIIQVVDGCEDIATRAFGYISKKIAHRLFGIMSDMVHVFLNSFQAIVFNNWSIG